VSVQKKNPQRGARETLDRNQGDLYPRKVLWEAAPARLRGKKRIRSRRKPNKQEVRKPVKENPLKKKKVAREGPRSGTL